MSQAAIDLRGGNGLGALGAEGAGRFVVPLARALFAAGKDVLSSLTTRQAAA